MPRRERRSGIRYIEDDRARSVTFSKRRSGLFKTASDMSTLTGAKVAVVVESENGKKSAFGTPLVNPIIDSFILGNAPPLVDEERRATITRLQNDLFQLEKNKVVEDKRINASMVRKKEIHETSRMAKHIYGNEKDLDVDELNELLDGLSQVQKDVNDRLHALHSGYQLEIGGARDPSLRLSSSWSQSQIQVPPRRFPWIVLESSSHLTQPSWLFPKSSRSQSSLLNPVILPSPQAPPMQQQQHQSHVMPLPTESHQNNYHFSQHSSQTPLLSSQPSPLAVTSSSSLIPLCNDCPPLSPLLELPLPFSPFEAQNLNPVVPSQNHTNNYNFTAGNPLANCQWSPIIPSNGPYYDTSSHGNNVCLGNNGYYAGQAVGGIDMPGPSGLHQQAYDRIDMTLFESSTGGENIFGDVAKDSHGDIVLRGAN